MITPIIAILTNGEFYVNCKNGAVFIEKMKNKMLLHVLLQHQDVIEENRVCVNHLFQGGNKVRFLRS